jgi:CheY-like chemotaxis protein
MGHQTSTKPVLTSPAHILVVESDPSGSELLRRILASSGYRVRLAYSAADAIRIYDEHDFDLVISDIGLPDMDGRTLMRALCDKRPVPGLAFSGYAFPTDHELSRAAGFAEHLNKPTDLDRLLEVVARVLAGPSNCDQARVV